MNKKTHASFRRSIEKILQQKRGYAFRIPKNEPVILLASGGLDSTIAFDKIIRDWNVKVYPLFIKRGAKNEQFEERAFDHYVKFYRKRFPKNIKRIFKLTASVPPKQIKPFFSHRTLRTIGYPLRDVSLANVGVQLGTALNEKYKLSIKTVVVAMTPDETFPHCSVLSLRLHTLLTCIDTDRWSWQIISPFVEPSLKRNVYKKDIIKWAQEFDINLERTRTCVLGKSNPCGTCQECLWRRHAFKDAGCADPISYKRKAKK